MKLMQEKPRSIKILQWANFLFALYSAWGIISSFIFQKIDLFDILISGVLTLSFFAIFYAFYTYSPERIGRNKSISLGLIAYSVFIILLSGVSISSAFSQTQGTLDQRALLLLLFAFLPSLGIIVLSILNIVVSSKLLKSMRKE